MPICRIHLEYKTVFYVGLQIQLKRSCRLMDFALLFISISLSSLGSFLDDYTTHIFVRDLGAEFEANKRVRNAIEKHGYRRELLYEAILVVLIGIVDSLRLYYSFFLFGLVILIVRGLTATHNFQTIVEYRTIGIDSFKEKVRLKRQAFQNSSLMNRVKYVLLYLVEALVCYVIYAMLLAVDSPLVLLSRYFVSGLAFFFTAMAYYSMTYYSSRKNC